MREFKVTCAADVQALVDAYGYVNVKWKVDKCIGGFRAGDTGWFWKVYEDGPTLSGSASIYLSEFNRVGDDNIGLGGVWQFSDFVCVVNTANTKEELLKDCEDVLSRVVMFLDDLYEMEAIDHYTRYDNPLSKDISELIDRLYEGDFVHE